MVIYDPSHNIVTVIAGIDGDVPPREIQRDISESINITVNQAADWLEIGRDSVTLTVLENPTKEQREVLGANTLYAMEFDVNRGNKKKNMDVIHATHNDIVDELTDLGFNITGTATIYQNSVQK